MNTLYFWRDAGHTFKELARVSTAAATLVITFMEADYLKSMPFSKYGFRFYSPAMIEQLLPDTPWQMASLHTTSEKIQGPKQTPVVRPYITLVLQK